MVTYVCPDCVPPEFCKRHRDVPLLPLNSFAIQVQVTRLIRAAVRSHLEKSFSQLEVKS